MIDYDRIISQLAEELDSCNNRYVSGTSTLVPAYYKQEIAEAIDLIINCRAASKDCRRSRRAQSMTRTR